MTASIYEALKDCIGASLSDIRAVLDSIAIDLFEPLWTPRAVEDDQDGEQKPMTELDFTEIELPGVIMYIIYAYSKDSKMLVFGSDFIEEKMRVADKVQLPYYLHGKCLKLKSACFREVMVRYLDYQGSRPFKQLQMKKDMYEALENKSFKDLFSDQMDMKAIENDMKAKDRLLDEIKTCEDQLRSEFKFVYDNKEDAKNARQDSSKRGKVIDNGNIENSPWLDYRRNKNNENIS